MICTKNLFMVPAGAALLSLLIGCSVGPDYKEPALPVPTVWNEAQQKGVGTRPADLARWWTRRDLW